MLIASARTVVSVCRNRVSCDFIDCSLEFLDSLRVFAVPVRSSQNRLGSVSVC